MCIFNMIINLNGRNAQKNMVKYINIALDFRVERSI